MKISEYFPKYEDVKSSATNEFIAFKMQHHIHDELYATVEFHKESLIYPWVSGSVGKDYFRFSFGTKNGFDIMHREYYDSKKAYEVGLMWMDLALYELRSALQEYEDNYE